MADFLIVDDNKTATDTLCALVRRRGHAAHPAYNGIQALAELKSKPIDVLVTDLRMPEMDGMMLLQTVREQWPELIVVVITAHGSVENAVEAMKLGAFDFITKPLDNNELQVKLQKAVAQREMAVKLERLNARVERFTADEAHRIGMGEIVGTSEPMQRVFESIDKVAPTESTVLILGESGTGKELVAHAIHNRSARAENAFVSVHCASYAEGILESELFGHEKGAFTGAISKKLGRFELADQGTFFLDEVGEIPMNIQTKLLRVLQEKEFERVGGTKPQKANIRIISATNRDLTKSVAEGIFREDLFYRLNVFAIELPPLRKKKQDIPLLVESLLHFEGKRLGVAVKSPTSRALDMMVSYQWPGNVRELRNVIERAIILAGNNPIDLEHLPQALSNNTNSVSLLAPIEDNLGFDEKIEAFEKQLILTAYEESGKVKAKAAKQLGIDRNRFRYKLEKFGILD
jgi:two-component system, NtrC family, response regulator HydG